ncbi:hypothetical protein [Methylobacterium durans]|uniref:hypothetical protein n=1 Tax=Methylobacterium durans TaxID=2202825 RepID=UPI0013A54ACB|nr:hypothetical protein [Methylobacterium durans]
MIARPHPPLAAAVEDLAQMTVRRCGNHHVRPLHRAEVIDQARSDEAYFLLADLTAALTMSFVDGAAAIVFGTSFFGFLASRFPCFFSEAMINLLLSLNHHRTVREIGLMRTVTACKPRHGRREPVESRARNGSPIGWGRWLPTSGS